MAVKSKSGCGGCLLPLLVLVLCVVVGYVAISQPLSVFGFCDKPIVNGKSIKDVGLDDQTALQLFPVAKALFTDNGVLVTDAPSDKDKTDTNDIFATSNVATLGKLDYSQLLYLPVDFGATRTYTLTGKQLSHVVGSCIKQASSNPLLLFVGALSGFQSAFEMVSQLNMTVQQITFTQSGEKTLLNLMLSIDASSLVCGLSLPVLGNVQGVHYLNVSYEFAVDGSGKITLENPAVTMDGCEQQISQKFVDAVLVVVAEQATTPYTLQQVTQFFADLLNHLVLPNLGNASFNAQAGSITFTA